MSERSPYYRGLSIPQIEALASVSDSQFQAWVTRGAPVKDIDDLLNEKIEEKRVRDSKGQVPPGSAAGLANPNGRVGDDGLVLAPTDRAPTSVELEYLDDDWKRFVNTYQQFIPSKENAKILMTYLSSRGGSSCYRNLVKAFDAMFGQFSLRIVEKGTEVKETTVTRGQRGQLAERVRIGSYRLSEPAESRLFETVLSPANVRALSADDTQKLMKPMSFPSITSSATDYLNSAEFQSETPESESRSDQEQTEAQIKREVEIFKISHPEFGRYLDDPEHYRGLYEIILERIGSWKLLINEASLLDAFKSIEADGILKSKDSDMGIQHGQVATMKVTPDARRHWTKSEIAKEIRDLSASEFQRRLNEDSDFRARVDSSR